METQVNEEQFYGEVEDHCFCERHRTCKRGGDIGKILNRTLPGIRYCESFESFFAIPGNDLWANNFLQPEFIGSQIKSTGGWELEDLGVAFINGILNTPESADQNALYLSRLANGYNIHYVFNATHGPTGDSTEYLLGRNYIATEPVKLLHKMWNSFFETRSAAAKMLMYCHSQGALHVRNALLDYPPELRERITVVAIAPGAYIYRRTCAQLTHYRNASPFRDCVPNLFDRKGARREKDTVTDIVSHPDASIWDHTFQSPTYRDLSLIHI